MDIEDNYCVTCSKTCTNLLTNDNSILYLNLLNQLYQKEFNSIQYEEQLSQKRICEHCSNNIEMVATFVKKVTYLNLNSYNSGKQCRVCVNRSDCLCILRDLQEELRKKIELFIKIVLNRNHELRWRVCVNCCTNIVFWESFRDFMLKFAKSIDKDKCPRTSDNLDGVVDENSVILDSNSNTLHDNVVIDGGGELQTLRGDISGNQETNNDITKGVQENIKIINSSSKVSLDERLKNLKTVSDLTLYNYRKLKEEIASNKQLMVEKPYVKLKTCNFENFKCSRCKKHFPSMLKTIKHELRYCNFFSPTVKLNRIDLTRIDSSQHDSKPSDYNILPCCEVVYSDDEISQNKNTKEAVTIDDSDEENSAGSNDHNYNKPNKNLVERTNYMGAYNNWLTTNPKFSLGLPVINQTQNSVNLAPNQINQASTNKLMQAPKYFVCRAPNGQVSQVVYKVQPNNQINLMNNQVLQTPISSVSKPVTPVPNIVLRSVPTASGIPTLLVVAQQPNTPIIDQVKNNNLQNELPNGNILKDVLTENLKEITEKQKEVKLDSTAIRVRRDLY